jgi:hypothetical protein
MFQPRRGATKTWSQFRTNNNMQIVIQNIRGRLHRHRTLYFDSSLDSNTHVCQRLQQCMSRSCRLQRSQNKPSSKTESQQYS